MSQVWAESFSPQVREDTQVLILGSMPGQKSLIDAEYYAHPRNVFWPIMEALFSIDCSVEYRQRLILLNINKVGLWDVYAKCYRPGSLDSSINKQTAKVNCFHQLLSQYQHIHTIFFNGKAAEQAFARHLSTELNLPAVKLLTLPSTSPANARLDFAGKLQAWQAVKEAIHYAE